MTTSVYQSFNNNLVSKINTDKTVEDVDYKPSANLHNNPNKLKIKAQDWQLNFVKKRILEAKFLNSLLQSSKSYEHAYKYKILEFLGNRLSNIANINNKKAKSDPELIFNQSQTLFYSKYTPKLSISKYLTTILDTYNPEVSTCVLLSIYLDKITVISSFKYSWNNVYR